MFSPHPNHLAARLRSIEATPWTEAEDQVLSDGYEAHTVAQLAARLNRTHAATARRARELGLGRRIPHYTEAEKVKIQGWLQEGKDLVWIAKELERSVAGVKNSLRYWNKKEDAHGQR